MRHAPCVTCGAAASGGGVDALGEHMNSRVLTCAIVGVVLVVSAGVAGAASSAALRCQAGKNTAAGKYAACRQTAEAHFVTTGDMTKYTAALAKCDATLTKKWAKLEQVAANVGASCPDAPLTGAQFGTVINECTDNLATALGGGGLQDCPATLATCTTNLNACNASLDSCPGNLTTCTTNLATCSGGLNTCTTNLTACQTTLGICGNGVKDGVEQCDGSDLGGATCSSLGFVSGTLACDSSCQFDTGGCNSTISGGILQTGQAGCYDANGTGISCAGTGQDGEFQKGLVRRYTDNGDGTITDTKTGLMWEKKDDNNVGGIHDKDNMYPWAPAFSVFIATLNSGSGFAGYTDWRLPNINELQSIASYGTLSPAVDPVFNTSCAAGCTVTTCSCTVVNGYFSATTDLGLTSSAWAVDFFDGRVFAGIKGLDGYMRAVRGGS